MRTLAILTRSQPLLSCLSHLFISVLLSVLYSSHVLPFAVAPLQSYVHLNSAGLYLLTYGLTVLSYSLLFSFSSVKFEKKIEKCKTHYTCSNLHPVLFLPIHSFACSLFRAEVSCICLYCSSGFVSCLFPLLHSLTQQNCEV